jgi:acylphosphatase
MREAYSAIAGSYSTDVEGGAHIAVRMRVAGALSADYLDFVLERAVWLGLSGSAKRSGPGAVEVVAAGPEALVGALEMACVLGPLDSLIATVDREPTNEIVHRGFAVRR